MKLQDAKQQLARIGRLYPTVMGMLQKKLPDGLTVGHVWAEKLTVCSHDDLIDVVDEFVDGKRPIPEPQDRLWQIIRDEASERWNRQYERMRTHEKYIRRPAGAMAYIASDKTAGWLSWLNQEHKAGRIDDATREAWGEEWAQWFGGKIERPAWTEGKTPPQSPKRTLFNAP